jgi:hypothetical protein
LAADAERERCTLGAVFRDGLEPRAVHLDADAAWVMRTQHRLERGVEERPEMAADRRLDRAAVEERRQGVAELQAYRRAALAHEPRRW